MPLEKQIGDAATALSQNQYVDALDGTYWVSGWDATLGSGDLEVDIAPGEGAINTGSVETTETQTVDFTGDVDADDPRKAVISVDDTGTVQKTLGDPMPADPEGEVRERTFDPAPPTNAPGVVVTEVWIAAGATALVGEDVRDRRVSNNALVGLGGPQIQRGKITQDAPTAASNDGWDSWNAVSKTVQFDESFESTPFIVLQPTTNGGDSSVQYATHQTTNVTSGEFTWRAVNYSTNDFSDDTWAVDYVAIEP